MVKLCAKIVQKYGKKYEKQHLSIMRVFILYVFLLTKAKNGLNSLMYSELKITVTQLHDPVLYEEVREIYLSQAKKHIIVDATMWLGGHASMMARELSQDDIFVWFDRDSENLALAREYLESVWVQSHIHYIHSSFAFLEEKLSEKHIDSIDFILYDLGVSSVHYDVAERGFSFRFDWPLDMRFDRSRERTVTDLLMTLDAPELARIFTLYGEEKKSWFIAQAIVKARKIETIDTTFKLLKIIEESSFDQKSPVRVFQALRIALNEEFENIESSLKQALELLSVGGKILVITFHSLEDRLVKNIFAPYLEDTINEVTWQIQEKSHYKKYTKKPIIPTDAEIERNPRSRSAKMRVIERIS
jgi:16S rRNA (cytosine1402-N4)-methyltransferase